jgi:hypothetical protein
MEIALGIAIGVSSVETLLLAGVAFIVATADTDLWKEHRKQTTARIRAWKLNWKNGEDHEIQE